MDFLPLLAQQEAPPAGGPAKRALEQILGNYPPEVAVPIFIGIVVVAALLIERIAVAVLRHMASKTVTKVDDALAECLPTILRPLVVLIALHMLVQQFLHDPRETSKLSPEGAFAGKALMVVSIAVLAVALVRCGTRMVDAWVQSGPDRYPVGAPIKLGIKVAMVPIALLAALQAIEYPIASLVTALGISSLAVGLALQDTLKNMFAGIQIVLDRPIRAGDFVEIDKNTRGTVLEVGLRSTKLRSIENNTVVIPNGTIANAIVVNFDIHDRSYAQILTIGVAYGSDLRKTQRILEQVAADAKKEIPAFSDEPARVWVRELGDSGVIFSMEVTFRQFLGRLPTVTELYHRCYERLRAEGIEIPFPTRTVYLRQDAPATASLPPAAPSR
jgi:small-conductance mechanosensitive channel